MKDLTMMVACESGARERTEAEYRDLLDQNRVRSFPVSFAWTRLATFIVARKR